ncbi:MAG: response regulator transcription factor [Bacteroidetes bacterium]|nr:response regulator transcription factor [Bacteroidota bacterium]
MLPLRAIIIDDEQKGINTLKILAEKHLYDVTVVAECTKASDGIELIKNYKPEIVFLDINMPEMNGFELLEKLSWKNFHLVFTTAHQEYALKALKINAIDYLLKPIDYRDLQSAIDRIKDRIDEREINRNEFDYNKLLNTINAYHRKKIIINSKSGVESIELPEIIHLESMSNYTQICLNDSRKIMTSKTLKEFDAQLCASENNFMRIHNSFIINLHKVSRYLKDEETIIMQTNQKIPLAKSRKEEFFRWMGF